MKKFSYSLFFLLSIYGLAQTNSVGINTTTPNATLHIKEKRINGETQTATSDGIIIPKLTAKELANKATATYKSRLTSGTSALESQEGTLVFVIADANGLIEKPTSGPSLAKVSEVNQEGLYYYGADDKWHFVGYHNLWAPNSPKERVELIKNSQGANRANNTEFVISDNGSVGIGLGDENPTKRLDINAANAQQQADAIRIRNLVNSPLNSSVKTLLIDQSGHVSKSSSENVEGKILRLPVFSPQGQYITLTADTTTNVKFENGPTTAPNSTNNVINTLNSTFGDEENVVDVVSLNPLQTINTTKPTSVKLNKGLYKVDIKIIGNFTAADVENSLSVKAFIDGIEYSEQNFAANTRYQGNRLTGFVYSDIIDLTQGTADDYELSFTLTPTTNNFTLVGNVNIGSYRSFRSVLLIERLK